MSPYSPPMGGIKGHCTSSVFPPPLVQFLLLYSHLNLSTELSPPKCSAHFFPSSESCRWPQRCVQPFCRTLSATAEDHPLSGSLWGNLEAFQFYIHSFSSLGTLLKLTKSWRFFPRLFFCFSFDSGTYVAQAISLGTVTELPNVWRYMNPTLVAQC